MPVVFCVTKSSVRHNKRVDDTLQMVQRYSGQVDTPEAHNLAVAGALRELSDKIATVKNAWVDPEVLVWIFQSGKIQGKATL